MQRAGMRDGESNQITGLRRIVRRHFYERMLVVELENLPVRNIAELGTAGRD